MVKLRPVRDEDWEAVHDWAKRDEVCRFQPWGPNTEADTRAFVSTAAAAWSHDPQDRYPYAIEVDGRVSGLADLKVLSQHHGEISYIVHPRLWGHGIATEAGRRLLEVGFGELGLHRIFGTCDPRNGASAQVLAKLGMSYEGQLRETVLLRDGWRDSDLYAVLEHEWRGGWQ
jgi:RimJ/RimL family protein N-acetyltransferase